MNGIPSELNKDLQFALLECGLFWDTPSLREHFKDKRIGPWRYSVPGGNTPIALVNGIIAFLYNRHNIDGENALALFLDVLTDSPAATETVKQELSKLANMIRLVEKAESEGAEIKISKRDIKVVYTIDNVEKFVAGDNYELSGDFSGAIVNVKSILENSHQTIRNLQTGSAEDKADFAMLVTQLVQVLQDKKLAQHEETLTEIAQQTKELVAEVGNVEATTESVQEKGNMLKKAAENVKEALPIVVEIAGGIVRAALRVAGTL